MDEKRHVQKELFEEFTDAQKKRRSKTIFQPKQKRFINISYERLVFLAIAIIILAVVSFSFGVEKGKRINTAGISMIKPAIETIAEVEEPYDEAEKEPSVEVTEEKSQEAVYAIQITSSHTKDQAEKEAEKLKKKGFKSSVMLKGKYYVVCAGEFKNRDSAKALEKELRKVYADCFIRKL